MEAKAYAIGLAINCDLLAAWFFTNLPLGIWNLCHRVPPGQGVYSKEELAAAAALKHGFWGDLWVCPLCLGTWLSIPVALAVALVAGLGPAVSGKLIFVLVAALTWPLGYFLLHCLVARLSSRDAR